MSELCRSSWGVMLAYPHPLLAIAILVGGLVAAARASWAVARR